jgi:hypothetical protein
MEETYDNAKLEITAGNNEEDVCKYLMERQRLHDKLRMTLQACARTRSIETNKNEEEHCQLGRTRHGDGKYVASNRGRQDIVEFRNATTIA